MRVWSRNSAPQATLLNVLFLEESEKENFGNILSLFKKFSMRIKIVINRNQVIF